MSDLILFTGAGFTKNFGGFLGDEMWSRIYNNPLISSGDELRKRFLDDENFNYEEIYGDVVFGDGFKDDDKRRVIKATEDAYLDLDSAIRSDQSAIKIFLKVTNWITKLFSDSKFRYFFTLNQDLLLERFLLDGISTLNILGMQNIVYSANLFERNYSDVSEFIQVSSGFNYDEIEEGVIQYIKIHGSYGWIDGDIKCMVLGINKKERMKRFPLLESYLKFLEKVINEGEKKLLVIGYSFRDEHINEKFFQGIKGKKLELFIICPSSPREFKKEIIKNCPKYGKLLFDNISGYFPCDLIEIVDRNKGDLLQRQIDKSLGR